MALPPLPKGAIFKEDGLPPLPPGAQFVSDDPSVPGAFEDKPIPAPVPPNKLVEFLSGGKSKDWEQYLYNNEAPEDTKIGKFNQLMQGLGSDALLGIPVVGEVGPAVKYLSAASDLPSMMKLPSMAHPLAKKASKALEPIVEKVEPIVEAVSDVASKAGEKIKEAPAKFLGWTSRTNPESLKTAYRVGKEGDKEVLKAFKAGKELELDDYSQMIYNYARKLGLPHEEALKATHYRQDLETGAWNLWNKYKNQNPLGLPGWNKATSTQKAKMAEQAGFDVGSYIPNKKNAKALLGLEGGLGYLASVTPWLQHLVSAKFLPALGLQSPKIAGELAYRTGQARRVVPSILKGVDNLTGPQAIGALQQINPTTED